MGFDITAAAEALVTAVVLSTDIFACGLAYGASKIKIPLKSAAVISLICGAALGVTLFLGGLLRPYISTVAVKYISFAILMAIGVFKLFEEGVKLLLAKTSKKELSLRIFDFRLILRVFQDETQADKNKDKVLSVAEAVSLAAATSLDSLAVGFSAGLTCASPWLLLLCVVTTGFAAVAGGTALGKKLASKTKVNLSWISGLVLIIIAVSKLL